MMEKLERVDGWINEEIEGIPVYPENSVEKAKNYANNEKA